MKINNILKALVAVTAVSVAGTVIYSKVKENKEKETKEIKTTEENVAEEVDPEPKKNIMKKAVEKFNSLSSGNKALVISVAGVVVLGLGVVLVGNRVSNWQYNRSLANYMDNQRHKIEITKETTNQLCNELSNAMIPQCVDDYVSKFMMRELVECPEDYGRYLDHKLQVNLLNSCYLCKILDEKLITPDQFDAISETVLNELTKDVCQEVE